MAIVSHTLVATSPNGARKTDQYEFVDHLGRMYRYSFFVDAAIDTNPMAIAYYATLDEENKDNEVQARVQEARKGNNPDILIADLNYWEDQQEFDRALLIAFMNIRMYDPLTFHYSLPFAIRSRNDVAPGNDTQRGARLFMSGADYKIIDDAYNLAQGVTSYYDTIATQGNYVEPERI